jgi:antitoxin HicB
MTTTTRKPLEYFLSLKYPFNVIADEDEGGYVVVFPDLPGCMTQFETLDELPAMVDEACALWIETAYEDGQEIPLPSYPEEYSGKFVARVPRSLHRRLVESAERDGVSLNQHVVALLAQGDALAGVARKLNDIEMQLTLIQAQLRYSVARVPGAGRARPEIALYQMPDPVAA